MSVTFYLPTDVARCAGYLIDGTWRDGCETCLRRTAPVLDQHCQAWMSPPAVIAFFCEYEIQPEAPAA